MDFRTKTRELIKTLLENIHEWRRLVLALSCFVVFITTYILILPAFTLDKEEAIEQGGIDVPAVEQSIDEDTSSADAGLGETEAAETASNAAVKLDSTEVARPAASGKSSAEITLQNDESDDFVVSVEGKDAGLSEDMCVEVREIVQTEKKQKKEYESLYNDALEAVQKAQTEEGLEKPSDFAFAKFYDISLMDGTNEVEPDKGVDVRISFSKELQKELKAADPERVHIVHFAVDKDTGEVIPEVLSADSTDITVKNNKVTEAAFTTDSFSVFAVVYTVDFHYEVDGEQYDFSINGGGFASLRDLVEALKVDDNAEEFVENIEKVEFSDPELVWVGKVNNDTTVGELKKANGLEPEYSADLTKALIEEADEHTVKAGDWALISLKPFTSEESLTVTMKNGDTWTVKVTDAQKPYKDVESLETGTYIIYNSFDSSRQAVFMKNDGTSYFTNSTTGTALNINNLSDFTWTVTKNNNGTFTIRSTKNNIYVNLWGNDHNTKDQFASSSYANLTLATESSGITISYGNKMLQRRTSGTNAGFYVHSSTYGKTPLTFYKIENDPSGGSSGDTGIILSDEEREEIEKWKETLTNFNTLTDYDKKAEVYDEDNRVFKIDITADSGITDFYKNVDLGLVLDVSNSMKFPSSLKALENSGGGEQQVWMTADQLNWAQRTYSSYYNQDGCFYIISDPALTSTIYKVFKDGNQWKYQDASENPGVKVFDINDGTVFKEPYRQAYTLYYADDKIKRMTYLQNSVVYAIDTLKKIVTPTEHVDDQTATVQVAYNFFAGISNSNGDSYAIRKSQDFVNLRSAGSELFTVSPAGNEASGTRQDLALFDTNGDPKLAANEFSWHSGYDKYVILVTDGAPNGATMNDVITAANRLKSEDNVKIIAIGLSTKDVDGGSHMLKTIADDIDGDGVPEFYEAEKAKDLEYILLKILRTIMAEGLVNGTITDTIDKAFYPVDAQGNSLSAGVYNASGTKISEQISSYVSNGKPTTAHKNDVFYTWEQVGDEWKITWYNQEIGWDDDNPSTGNPWTGTVYVKAKEDYLGGNLIETNDGNAQIEPTGIKLVVNGTPEANWRPLENMDKINLPVPRVNVHNLETKHNDTTWTVYKGTSVTPKEQIKALWDNIPIEEVVSSSEEGLHKRTTGSSANVGTAGDGETFSLESLMSEVAPNFDIDTLIDQITASNSSASQEFVYNAYGHESGKITVKVERTAGNKTPAKHDADTVGTAVEQYKVTFTYTPYTEDERMDGKVKDSTDTDNHNGSNGRGSEETGTISSVNTHTINVIKKAIEITKVDTKGDPITGNGKTAQFTIYRTAKSGETVAEDDRLPEGSFTAVATISTDPSTGKAVWDPVDGIKDSDNTAWLEESKYYIVETEAPENYIAYNDNIPVTMTITESTVPVLTSETEDVLLYNLTHAPTVTVTGDDTGSYITDVVENNDGVSFKVKNDENGSLKLRKWVTIGGVSPDDEPDLKTKADGEYTFSVTGVEGTPTAGITRSVKIKIENGIATRAWINEVETEFDNTNDLFVEIPDLKPGDYIITEEPLPTTINDVYLSSIFGGKDDGDIETQSITVTVTSGKSGDDIEHIGKATFTNNFRPDSEEDIAHIRIKKTFEDLPEGSSLDPDFKITIQVAGKTYELTSNPEDPAVTFDGVHFPVCSWTVSVKGMLINEPVTVTEVNAGYPDYDVTTSVNGVENTSTYTGTVSSSTIIQAFNPHIYEPNNKKDFNVTDTQIFMARLTDGHVLVISKNRLSLSERAAIEGLLDGTTSPGMGEANWHQHLPPYYYVADENRPIHFKGSTITYNNNIVHFDKKCQWTHTAEVAITYNPGDPADFNFVNTYEEKTVDLDILKVNEDDPEIKLPGAQFTIRKIKDTLGANDVEYDGDESDPITTGANGDAKFENITQGYYEIRESKIPDGYVITGDRCFYIKVDDGVISLLEKDLTKNPSEWDATKTQVNNVTFTAASGTADAKAQIGNTPGAELPHTGGIGTTLFYLLGVMLALGSAAMYVSQRRSQKKS